MLNGHIVERGDGLQCVALLVAPPQGQHHTGDGVPANGVLRGSGRVRLPIRGEEQEWLHQVLAARCDRNRHACGQVRGAIVPTGEERLGAGCRGSQGDPEGANIPVFLAPVHELDPAHPLAGVLWIRDPQELQEGVMKHENPVRGPLTDVVAPGSLTEADTNQFVGHGRSRGGRQEDVIDLIH